MFICLVACLCVCVCVCVVMFSFVSFLVSLFFDYLCSDKCQNVDEDFDTIIVNFMNLNVKTHNF